MVMSKILNFIHNLELKKILTNDFKFSSISGARKTKQSLIQLFRRHLESFELNRFIKKSPS